MPDQSNTATWDAANYPTYYGDPIKSLGANRSGGLLVCFTDKSKRDLTHEWFDEDTNFMLGVYPIVGVPTLYQHGLDESVGSVPVGRIARVEVTSKGIYVEQEKNFFANFKAYVTALKQPQSWLEEQLDYAADYDKMLDEMERNGELAWSSGAHPPSVRVAQNGHIDQWAIWEGTNTMTPAMPYETRILPVKSHLSYMQPLSARLSGAVSIGRKDGSTTVRDEGMLLDAKGRDRVQINTTTHSFKSEKVSTMKSEDLQKVIASHAATFAEELTKALMDSGDDAAGEEDAATLGEDLALAAMAAAPEEMVEAEAVDTKSLLELIRAAAPQVLAARAATRENERLSLKNMALSAIHQGRESAGAAQLGTSKVKGFSKDTPQGKGVNVNLLGDEYAPGLLSAIKSQMPMTFGYAESAKYSRHSVKGANKALNPYAGATGGYLLSNELAPTILDPLRAESIAFKLGVTQQMLGNTGSYSIAKMTVAPTAFRPGINTAISDATPTYQSITLFPKPIAAMTIIPRQQLLAGLPDTEDQIRRELIKSIQLQVDKEIFIGTGSVVSPDTGAGIRGILQVAASANQAVAATNGRQLQFTDMIAAQTQLENQNVVDDNSMGYALHPTMRGTLRSMTDTTGQPLFRNNYSEAAFLDVIGYPLQVSTQIPKNITTGTNANTSYMFYGRWSDGVYGMLNDVAILVDEITLMDDLQVRIIAYTFSDFIVKYPEAFYVLSGITA